MAPSSPSALEYQSLEPRPGQRFFRETYRNVSFPTDFVHSGDDFLGVETDGGLMGGPMWSAMLFRAAPNPVRTALRLLTGVMPDNWADQPKLSKAISSM